MSSDNAMSTTDNTDDTRTEDIHARVDVLEAKMDWIDDHIVSRLTDVEDRLDGHDELKQEVADLRAELETLHKVDEGAASTPEKRRKALQKAMLNQFNAREEAVALDYNEVITALEQQGHGEVYPAQAYRAMEDAGEYPGFEDGKIVKGGETVAGIKLVSSEVPASLTPEQAVNRINNETRSASAAEAGESSSSHET